MKKTIALVIIAGLCAFLFTGALWAQNTPPKEKEKGSVVKSQIKEVQGEVSYITKRSISVVFARDEQAGTEEEVLLPFDETVVIEHKRDISEIKAGDIVLVRYADETVAYGERKQNIIQAKVIRFLQPAGQDSPYRDPGQAPDEGESLTLKGVKQ